MIRNIFYIIGIVILFSSCTFIGNVKDYSEKSKELINSIAQEQYNEVSATFESEKYGKVNKDLFIPQIEKIRELIVNNFGMDYDLKFIHANKTTLSTEEPGPYPTTVQIQIKNKTHYGNFTLTFDDEIHQVTNIRLDREKYEIPSMTLFWFYGLLPLLVVGFNIYTIRRVSKSRVKRKWLKIVGIVLLNVPAFTYSVVNGFNIEPLSFQILLGMSFGMMGYANTFWTFGFPIGSLIANYKINQSKKIVETNDTVNESEIIENKTE